MNPFPPKTAHFVPLKWCSEDLGSDGISTVVESKSYIAYSEYNIAYKSMWHSLRCVNSLLHRKLSVLIKVQINLTAILIYSKYWCIIVPKVITETTVHNALSTLVKLGISLFSLLSYVYFFLNLCKLKAGIYWFSDGFNMKLRVSNT